MPLGRSRFPVADLDVELYRDRSSHFLHGKLGELLDVIGWAIAPNNNLVAMALDLELVDPAPSALHNSAFDLFIPFWPRHSCYVEVHDGHHVSLWLLEIVACVAARRFETITLRIA
jgi:hypothetical protein